MPNLVNVAARITPLVLNPEFVSRYGWLYEVERRMVAGTHRKTRKDGFLFSDFLLRLIPKRILPFAGHCLSLLQVMFVLRILCIFFSPRFHLNDLCKSKLARIGVLLGAHRSDALCASFNASSVILYLSCECKASVTNLTVHFSAVKWAALNKQVNRAYVSHKYRLY